MKEYIMADYDGGQKIGDLTVVGELIRCQDCRYHIGYNCVRLYGLQDVFTTLDIDFCSRAVRKGVKSDVV